MARTLCIQSSPFLLFVLILSFIQIIFLLPLLYYGFQKSIKTNSLPKLFKFTYWFTCFVLFIAGTSFPVHQMLNFSFSGYCDNYDRMPVSISISLISYMISLICICYLYLMRIILSFKNSSYSISKFVYICFISVLLIQIILAVFTVYYDIVVLHAFGDGDFDTFNKTYPKLLATYVSFGIVIVVDNIVLLVLYLMKVYKLNKIVSKKKDIFNLKTSSVVYTLCLSIAAISTLITTSWGWIRDDNLLQTTNESYNVHLTLIAYDIFLNCLSLNLQLEYQNNVLFHKCCGRCLNCWINKIIKKNDCDDDDIDGIGNSTQLMQIPSHSTT